MTSGNKAIAFGDFSYYWIIQRQPLTVNILKEKYILNGEIGFTGYERLDGKLILPEAVKLLKIA
jgi:HK97 family phage major capsid protein